MSRSDDYNRPDNASSVGTPSDGGSPPVTAGSGGSTWGIAGNQAYNPAADGSASLLYDAGTPVVTVQVTFATYVDSASSVVWRALDENSQYRAVVSNSNTRIYKTVAGVPAFIGTGTGAIAWADGDVIKVVCDASDNHSLYRNGTLILGPFTDPSLNTVTKHGIGSHYSSAARFDNLSITTAADTTPPAVPSASVDSAGTTLTVNYTESASPPVLPATSVTGYTLKVNGVARTTSSWARSGTAPGSHTATIASAVYSSDTVTLDYSPGNVTDSATPTPNAMTSFTGKAVTNNSTQSSTMGPGSPSSTTVKVDVAASAASGGTAPYAYQWYGSTANGFTPGAGNLLSGQTAQALTAYVVTPGSTYYFVRRATDSAGPPVTADTSQYTVSAVSGSGGGSYPRGRFVNNA